MDINQTVALARFASSVKPIEPSVGPWKFKPRMHEGKLIALILETEHRPVYANDPAIFALRQDWMGTLSPQREADKRWIERVPEMYTALKEIAEVLEKHPEANIGNKVVHYALHKARSAIAQDSTHSASHAGDGASTPAHTGDRP